jgi:hypothetical protein
MPDKQRRMREYDQYIDSIIFCQSPCFFCKRLIDIGKQAGDSDEVFPDSSCDAFPGGIPAMIARGEFNHIRKWNPEN